MRGENTKQSSMLMLMSPESRVPKDHPIRQIKKLADDALTKLSPTFDEMYSRVGRPSIPPERLLKSTLLMALYTIRSERQFCEQLDYNLLFRWFLDMDMDESSFVPTVFTHNRNRLIAHDVAGEFFRAVVERARAANLMSSDHFTVDGTLIEAAASLKSFKPKDDDDEPPPDDPGNPTVNFHGETRSNDTHESTTDRESVAGSYGNSWSPLTGVTGVPGQIDQTQKVLRISVDPSARDVIVGTDGSATSAYGAANVWRLNNPGVLDANHHWRPWVNGMPVPTQFVSWITGQYEFGIYYYYMATWGRGIWKREARGGDL